jgi:hypothetical protein
MPFEIQVFYKPFGGRLSKGLYIKKRFKGSGFRLQRFGIAGIGFKG